VGLVVYRDENLYGMGTVHVLKLPPIPDKLKRMIGDESRGATLMYVPPTAPKVPKNQSASKDPK
jgi:hypothetical protein